MKLTKNLRQTILIFFLGLYVLTVKAQPVINILDSNVQTSLRGLSVVNENVIWASGSNGMVARSVDGGKNFIYNSVKGFDKRDFRDVHAFDEQNAIIIGIAEPAIILRTKDGGKSWKEVFKDDTKGMFLDAMDFDEKGNGMVVGDPINNKIFIATTGDKGKHWSKIEDAKNSYLVENGEAMFASSGSNVNITNDAGGFNIFLVTGGMKSRLFFNGFPVDINMQQGAESKGANALAVNATNKKIVIVGGDFNNPKSSEKNCILVNYQNNRLLFTEPLTPPKGYKSSVTFVTPELLVSCGTSGIDVSYNGGIDWSHLSDESFHACRAAKNSTWVFLVGKNGRIAKMKL